MTTTPPEEDRWLRFLDATSDSPPRDTLVRSLDLFQAEGYPRENDLAIDLGCGSGNDALEILGRGWRLFAVDAHPEAIRRVVDRVPHDLQSRLDTKVARFEDLALPPALLLNASFSLPFCPPAAFPRFWQMLLGALQPGGRLSGQLFGDRDEWADREDMTFQTREEAESLLAPLEIEMFEEIERDGKTAVGTAKHWHIFSVVARRPHTS
jgi:tellurite methyltransferase